MSANQAGKRPEAPDHGGQPQKEKETQGTRTRETHRPWFLLVFYGAFALVFAWSNPQGRAFLIQWWWLVAAIAVLILGTFLFPAVRRRIDRATGQTRVRLIVFVVIPFSFVLYWVATQLLLPAQYQVPALRFVFVLAVCLFPGIMYYLFIATRRPSLLSEFLSNLDRLGLRDTPMLPHYLRRFEAVYGPPPPDLVKEAIEPDLERVVSDFRMGRAAGTGLAAIFTPETTIPLGLATGFMMFGWLITLPPWGITGDAESEGVLALWRALIPERTPVHFAFLGAYFFSLQMLFRRYVRRDLRASAYVAVSLRIIIAVILIWVVEEAFYVLRAGVDPAQIQSQLIVLGFVIGVFPPVAWQLIQAALKKVPGGRVVIPGLETQLPLSDLDGLTVWHQSRLEEEDIENIPNMATADLVELMLQTRFPGDRIIDWVDQAILYTTLGSERGKNATNSQRAKLRLHGIRTATSLLEAYKKSKDRKDVAKLEEILATDSGGRSPIRALVDTAEANPNLLLIRRWREWYAADQGKKRHRRNR